MIFESHAHYDDDAFAEDRDVLLSSMKENGIEYIVNVSSDIASVNTTLLLAEKYDFVYAAVGIHPSDTQGLNEEIFAWLKEQACREKVVAIGEIGLDYHWKEPEPDYQKKWFIRQLQMAGELKKPVIIHSRDAAADTLSILRDSENHLALPDLKGVIHCYSYSKEMAKTFLNLGWYFGIGGVITFANAKKLVETVEYLPLESILLETDCPYLSPQGKRGQRNDPSNIPLIAQYVADYLNLPPDEVAEKTTRNTKSLYGLM